MWTYSYSILGIGTIPLMLILIQTTTHDGATLLPTDSIKVLLSNRLRGLTSTTPEAKPAQVWFHEPRKTKDSGIGKDQRCRRAILGTAPRTLHPRTLSSASSCLVQPPALSPRLKVMVCTATALARWFSYPSHPFPAPQSMLLAVLRRHMSRGTNCPRRASLKACAL